jgi:hypothetical protein
MAGNLELNPTNLDLRSHYLVSLWDPFQKLGQKRKANAPGEFVDDYRPW